MYRIYRVSIWVLALALAACSSEVVRSGSIDPECEQILTQIAEPATPATAAIPKKKAR